MANLIKIKTESELDQLLDCVKREQWRELILLGSEAPSWYVDGLGDVLIYQIRFVVDDLAQKVTTLTSLTALDLSWNEIGDEGTRSIANLSNLSSLYLSLNNIGDEGARALAMLSNLTVLDLHRNNIGDEGARALANLSNLTVLDLHQNTIGDEGTWALAMLSKLTSLDLGGNSIGNEGARALAMLSNLTSLDLTRNSIGDEGVQVLLNIWCKRSNADQLKKLDLRSNPLRTLMLSLETIESTDAQAILAAWRAVHAAQEMGRLRPLNAAKLLVVGSEAVGKTSLVRYLTSNKAHDPCEQKTSGTEIHERIEINGWSPDASNMRVSIWDFGGQEIMHGTHRYFLTQRSLYLLVLEDRREDNCPIQDWLNIIANRAGASPVIVIINKSDNGKEALLLAQEALKRDHPSIVAFHRTSCNADNWAEKSIEDLRELIAKTLTVHPSLTEIRNPVAASWLWVKNKIADLAKDQQVVSLDDFERLCRDVPESEQASGQDLQSPDERRFLLRLLHDLGVVVAYGFKLGDLVVKRETVLLNPNWLTGAIYTILNHKTLLQQNGIFYKHQLTQWLDPNIYPMDRHEYILTMMQEEDLGLCFPLPGTTDQFLVPEGLPVEIRAFQQDEFYQKGCLRFRYRYNKLLPPGLIPRFIVEAHKKLENTRICWRSGAVFEAAQCRVLVSADRNKRLVDVAVKGPSTLQRAALNVILDDLERVHELHGDLGVEARVPLSEQPDIDVSYKHLLTLEAEDGPDCMFRPEGGNRKYTVQELLDGVRRDTKRQEEIDMQKPNRDLRVRAKNVTIIQVDGKDARVVGRDEIHNQYTGSVGNVTNIEGTGHTTQVGGIIQNLAKDPSTKEPPKGLLAQLFPRTASFLENLGKLFVQSRSL